MVWTSPKPSNFHAPGMKKNSPYTKFFKEILNKFKENGVLDGINENYLTTKTISKSTCSQEEGHGNPLVFLKLGTLFIFLVIGAILSICISLFERCNKRKFANDTKLSVHQERLKLVKSIRKLITLLEKLQQELDPDVKFSDIRDWHPEAFAGDLYDGVEPDKIGGN